MNATDVVVTGLGMVTPLGITARETMDSWRRGECAGRHPVKELEGTRLARIRTGAIPAFDSARSILDRKMRKYMSDAAVLASVAAREAVSDGAIASRFRPERIGLYAGTGLTTGRGHEVVPMLENSLDEKGRLSLRRLGERGLPATNPLLSFKILANMPPCIVSILEKIQGPNLIFTPFEGQTGAALIEAWRAGANREVDCALTGAADHASHPSSLVYLKQAGILRDSELPSPGAAYLTLERRETAMRDGRRIYARLVHLELATSDAPVRDPLATRMGRTYAAAPAILLALAAASLVDGVEICGVDRHWFRAKVEPA